MLSGRAVPSTTSFEITTSSTPSRLGRSNMVSSRIPSMIERRPRAPVTRSLEPSILSMTGVRAIRASGPCDDNGVASFDLVRHHRANDSVFLYAFDLIELNGD